MVWFATMYGGFPWPAFVMVATGAKFLQAGPDEGGHHRSIERDLEKKERKRLEAQKRDKQDGAQGARVNRR